MSSSTCLNQTFDFVSKVVEVIEVHFSDVQQLTKIGSRTSDEMVFTSHVTKLVQKPLSSNYL